MRVLFLLLAAVGAGGVMFGTLDLIRGAPAPNHLPFPYETYGGPGVIIAGLLMVSVALYLASTWGERG